jgi:hypothetical protein
VIVLDDSSAEESEVLEQDNMSIQTESERQFENFAQAAGWAIERITPTGTSRTPDFRVHISGIEVVAEIKQIDADPLARAKREAGNNHHEAGVTVVKVGERVRMAIGSQAGQLKASADSGIPTLLVIYEATRPTMRIHTDPIGFLAGMYGAHGVVLGLTKTETFVKGVKFGGGRKMTATANTSVSATACLYIDGRGEWSLDIYDNVHAKVRFPFAAAANAPNVSCYTVNLNDTESHNWIPIVNGANP